MAELLPGIHTIDGVNIDLAGAELGVHPILLVEDSGLTLIDAGPVGAEHPIRAYVEGIGHSLADVQRIIVTHHHSDHTGALARLASETDAVISAHADEVAILERRVPEPARPVSPEGIRAMGIDLIGSHYLLMREWEASFTPPAVTITDVLQGGDMLPVLGGLLVLHDPGHSPGHIALLSEAHSVLFAADLFYHEGGRIQIPLPVFTQDAGRAVETMRTIVETLEFDVAIPYHGAPLVGEACLKLRRALSGVRKSVGHALPGVAMPSG